MVNLSDEVHAEIRYTPHLKLSMAGDHILADLCL